MKKALIIGITGQDGSYLAELLLEKGYEVHGVVRRSSSFNRQRIEHLTNKENFFEGSYGPTLHYGDLSDSSSIERIIESIIPDEIYNLGAQSHVGISFEIPENTVDIVGVGALRVLEAIRKFCPTAKYYQASSSEMYGKVRETPQNENTPFHPRSPYACAKAFAFMISRNYREAYNIFACNGILFNHESERRGENFVTRKITRSLGRIKVGLQKQLFLGNLDAERDWGHAKDYVKAMWLMLQQETPKDYVIGTGEKHTVREFLEVAINEMGLNLKSNGKRGLDEAYVDLQGNEIIKISKDYFRPSEVNLLLADPSKAKLNLNWNPIVKFEDLVKMMVRHDLKLAEKGLSLLKIEKEIKDDKEEVQNTGSQNIMQKVKISKIGPVHQDGRGEIWDLLNKSISHVGVLTCKKDSIRGNHYFKTSKRYAYVLSGMFKLVLAPSDAPNQSEERILETGDLVEIPPGVIHTFKAIKDSILIGMDDKSREGEKYKEEMVRVNILEE